jgi:hypothetical protein
VLAPANAEGTLLQVRLRDPRCGALAKGLLLPCADLPPATIHVTHSMVKAPQLEHLLEWQQAGQQQAGQQQGEQAGGGAAALLDVVNHCEPPGTGRLNRYLLLLLAHGGVDEQLIRRWGLLRAFGGREETEGACSGLLQQLPARDSCCGPPHTTPPCPLRSVGTPCPITEDEPAPRFNLTPTLAPTPDPTLQPDTARAAGLLAAAR